MIRLLWRTMLGLLALAVFLVALALYWPAADWLPRVLPANVKVDGITGSLREGRLERVTQGSFSSGPWQWHLRSPTRFDVQLGESGERPWTLQVSGWPGAWNAVSHGGDARWWQAMPLFIGRFEGTLQWSGQWRTCKTSQGRLQADSTLLLVPYPLGLGTASITSDCSEAPMLNAQVRLPSAHALDAGFDLSRWQGRMNGSVEPSSALGRVMRTAGLLKEGQRQVELRF
jgi:general secretion pathway protein N